MSFKDHMLTQRSNNLNLNTHVKTQLRKLLNRTKTRKETMNRTCSGLSLFLLFSVGSINKKMLVNNKIYEHKKKEKNIKTYEYIKKTKHCVLDKKD